jgi:hypothetical protein
VTETAPLSRHDADTDLPELGALSSLASTIVVAANAQLLRRVDLRLAPLDNERNAASEPVLAHS